jgi:hypothetical protein
LLERKKRMSITWQKRAIRLGSSLGLLFGVLAFAGIARAQGHQIRGLIVARSGATMTVKTPDSENIVVALPTIRASRKNTAY